MEKKKTIVITSGYFNPIHPGHIECFKLCKELGDELWVIVNSDKQVKKKTGDLEPFQNQEFRQKIVKSIKYIDEIFLAVDQDQSVSESIKKISEKIREKYGLGTKIIFGKGGDRFVGNIPEVEICKKLNIKIIDGLGKKIDNSRLYREKKHFSL